MTKNMKTIVIVGLIAIVAALSVAYAALSKTLNITGTATLKQNTWSIAFGSGSCAATGSATAGTVSGSGTTTASVSGVKLALPGDTVTCTVPITNNGTINATLSSISYTAPTISGTSDTDIKSWITASVTYDGVTLGDNATTNLNNITSASKQSLNTGITKNVVIKYTYSSSATKVPGADVTIGSLAVSTNYVQS